MKKILLFSLILPVLLVLSITSAYGRYGEFVLPVSDGEPDDSLGVLPELTIGQRTEQDMEQIRRLNLATMRETIVDGNWLEKAYTYSVGTGQLSETKYTANAGDIGTELYGYTGGYHASTRWGTGGAYIWKLDAETIHGLPLKGTTGSVTRTYSYDARCTYRTFRRHRGLDNFVDELCLSVRQYQRQSHQPHGQQP